MLADIKRDLTGQLGIIDENAGVAQRATYIVDPEGVIRFAYVTDLSVGRNPQEVLRVLDALQTDELCPCNWQKGQETLTFNHDSPVAPSCKPAEPFASARNLKMTLNALIETLPDYAKDMRLNFSSVVSNQTDLNEQQLWGTVVACAMTSRNEDLTATALEEAASHLSASAWRRPSPRRP